ncbi:beta-ketoacyl synthase N-terminal-like domain-containing protein [Isoptericola dokdonensis]|uniref:Probable acetyl-CoA acetyltransferase n=1 Tax=Isoptericola dokdonensis DS-3 TaxID=1300344 RepID=A0A168F144_9MICO|nr:beta-ketoacyl synthase N-terminal-like domain-containing protein [Isoptericola dokdonensis]ANC30759.1 Putative acetyl-CoA C-acetyltransferase YhfS [Isoptericola dokdonensis DS-3]
MSVVVAARRTWVGRAGRGHAAQDETTLAAAVLAACARDAARDVDDVVLGNAAGHGGDVARRAALAALGRHVPGVGVDRQCASGLAAVNLAAALVDAGHADVVLAGGVEVAGRAPARAHGPLRYDRASFAPPPWADPDLGVAAEALATRRGIGRERQHACAAASHARVLAAHRDGRFAAETVPAAGLHRDEHARSLRAAVEARLPGAFAPGGSVTALSAAPAADGAAAVAIVADGSRPTGVPGLRVVATATVAGVPAQAPLAVVPAVRAACSRGGVRLDDVAAFEVVEAFAAQVLAVGDDLGVDVATDLRWNPDGGALGYGHPFGASGAVALVRLFARLVGGGAPPGTFGLAAAAAAGGQGVAVLVEVLR